MKVVSARSVHPSKGLVSLVPARVIAAAGPDAWEAADVG